MTQPEKTGVLCLFTRTPKTGQVKTRLIPELGEVGATRLYRGLLKTSLQTACSSSVHTVRLYCWPEIDHPFLHECAEQFSVQLWLQEGDDLGERMNRALKQGLEEFDHALVLGCDCPSITPGDLDLACDRLTDDADLVLGPAMDGGYYLLGLSLPCDFLFDDMSWGTAAVLPETKRRIAACGLEWSELPTYRDIDRPEDLIVLEAAGRMNSILQGR